MNPSASSVMNAAKTAFEGCALIAATTFAHSPLRAGTGTRPVAFPPFFARPSANAIADSVPKASSAYTRKASFPPVLATHSPSGSASCHDVEVLRKTYLLRQLGEQPAVVRV